jgi:hypothetical protein
MLIDHETLQRVSRWSNVKVGQAKEAYMVPDRRYVWPPARVINRISRRLQDLSEDELKQLYSEVWRRYVRTPNKHSRTGDVRLSEGHSAFTTAAPNHLRFQ